MIFKTLASGSSGNSHIIDDGKTKILIDAGISWKRIKMALDFKTHSINGCLVCHGHADHAGHVKDVARAGIDVWMLPETREALDLDGHRYHDIDLSQSFRVGSFQVRAFNLRHDVPNCGFLIASDIGEKMLYITDTAYVRNKFPAVDLIAIECNYSAATLAPHLDPTRKKRLYSTHMSLETVKKFLAANDLSKVKEIHLIHLSRENADPEYFKTEIMKSTGKPVTVCR